MAHYAKVDQGKVLKVIVADEDYINSFVDTEPGNWIQTSYNTRGGIHTLGGTPLRKNFAAVGMTYDAEKDAFIPPKPYASWVLNDTTCLWEAPVSHPNEKGEGYRWNESTISWEAL
jgi:hypothetical protein